MGHHIDEEGRFQSDKYPELPPDHIRLSFHDWRARMSLRTLAQAYRQEDPELAADITARLDALENERVDAAAGENG